MNILPAWLRHRRRTAPAPADTRVPGPAPVPGHVSPGTPPPMHRPRQAPAPGSPHGGIAYSIRSWNCGRIRVWDGHGKLAYARACGCPVHMDLSDEALGAAIEEWANDQH